jgi:hypothetical protein
MHLLETLRIEFDNIDFKNYSALKFMAGFGISEVGF